ncbi:MAG TPA: S9 family peptidase [Thermoanaerobaculia bacterium]|nr:S9 family peptidase [Thermoanaerobaculia bacterium]
MKRTLALLLLVVATAAHARNITEKDLFKFNWIGDPQLSPDGSQVAFVRVTVDEKKDTYNTAIWAVAARAGAEPRRITNGPRDASPRWSRDGKLLAFTRSIDKDGKPQPAQVWVLRFDGGEPHVLTALPKAAESIAWSPSSNTIAFTATTKPDDLDKKDDKKKDDEHESDVRVINQAVYRANGAGYRDASRDSHIWTIDVPDSLSSDDALPKPKQLTSGEFDERDVTWSPDGSQIYFTSNRVRESYFDRRDTDLFAIPAGGGEMKKVADIEGPIGSYAVSPDGKWIAFAGEINNPVHSYDQPDLWLVATAPGSTPRNLTASYDYDILSGVGGDQRAPRAGGGGARPVWSDDGKTIYAVSAEEGRVNLKRIDVASGRIAPWTTGNHDIQSHSIRGGKTVALISTPTIIGDLYLVAGDGAMTRLTNVNDKLMHEVTLTEPEEIWYTSFDGRKIQTWVQKPPDFDATKKYPLILNIHGGPHSAYGYTFDHEFQWMAAKGYVVLYPNPRGSTSYGQDFGNIIQYHYPGDDFKDLMAGVDAVVARGYIDPKKLCVTGGSGGGLLTDWVVTQTDRFAAAAAQRDIADWSTFWYVADFSQFQPSWFRKAPWEDPKDYVARSPITYIDRVKTPLMLILGEADYRTPPMSGGEMMFRALKYRHIPTVMIRFPDESHELSRSGKPWHRIERLEHIVGWFDHWVMGVPKPEYEEGLRK